VHGKLIVRDSSRVVDRFGTTNFSKIYFQKTTESSMSMSVTTRSANKIRMDDGDDLIVLGYKGKEKSVLNTYSGEALTLKETNSH
jgi:DNA topoisomerase VI subunit A